MKYQKDFLKMIVLAAKGTVEHEPTCDECWEQVDRFAELSLTGQSADDALPIVREHLIRCPECGDEFTALLNALKSTARGSVYERPTGT